MKYFARLFVMLFLLLSLFSCEEKDEDPPVSNGNIFYDQCEKSSEWPAFDNESAQGLISNGFYELEHKIDNPDVWYSVYLTKDLSGSYTMETAIKLLEDSEHFKYGMIFLRKDNYNHYYFYLDNQQFDIGYIYNYNDHLLAGSVPSAAINPTGEADTLKVSKDQDHLDFYINNEKVYEIDMTNYVGEEFGYKLVSKGKVAIDYIKIYR